MSNFQRASFGQVWDTGSFIHKLDARTRLLTGLILIGTITASQRVPGLCSGIVIALAYLLVARIPLKHVIRRWLTPMPVVLLLAMLQALFAAPQADPWFEWTWIHISRESVVSGVLLVVRFSGLLLSLNWLSFCLSITDMVRAIERLLKPLNRLGIPTHDAVLGIQVALTFIPLLMREVDRITKAQASRGAEWGTGHGGLLKRARQALPILIPLFLTTLQRAENLAQAIVARGYGGPRTSRVELFMTERDVLLLLVAVSAGCGIVLL